MSARGPSRTSPTSCTWRSTRSTPRCTRTTPGWASTSATASGAPLGTDWTRAGGGLRYRLALPQARGLLLGAALGVDWLNFTIDADGRVAFAHLRTERAQPHQHIQRRTAEHFAIGKSSHNTSPKLVTFIMYLP